MYENLEDGNDPKSDTSSSKSDSPMDDENPPADPITEYHHLSNTVKAKTS